MVLSSLRLQHFRSYEDQSFTFKPGVNIIVGPNASGKTNLLEAILVTARGGSYRAKDAELISFQQPWARLDTQNRTVKLETEPAFKKSYIIDGQPLARLSMQRTIPVVVFEPNHLLLLTASPDLRRSYLDDVLEQSQADYSAIRRNYRRTLAQRNALLKQGLRAAERQIFPWNIRLSELGGQIVRRRQELVSQLHVKATERYKELVAVPATIELNYDSQWHAEHYETMLLRKLESNLEVDTQRGFTTAGPHRDDLLVMLNGQPANISASRGETRSLVLLLKVMELELLESARQQPPILLLDDVFSELDNSRRQAMAHYLHRYQTFITTTDADQVKDAWQGTRPNTITIKP